MISVTNLYGLGADAAVLRRHGVHGSMHVGVNAMTVNDGAARGLRLLDLIAGPHLTLRVAVDRGFDPYVAIAHGWPVGWESATGLRALSAPAMDADAGLGLLRGFSGLMVTCGLDWIGAPAESSAEVFGHLGRTKVQHPLHGRASTLPSAIQSAGVDWERPEPVVYAEARIGQAMVFGENLQLVRRIELPIGGREFALVDEVCNLGFRATPHRILYHWNFGAPLLGKGAQLDLPTIDAPHRCRNGDGTPAAWNDVPQPLDRVGEAVFSHRLRAQDDGWVKCRLRSADGALGAELRYDSKTLPRFYQWQAFEAGIYVLGLEPASHAFSGVEDADLLGPGETRVYRQSMRIDS